MSISPRKETNDKNDDLRLFDPMLSREGSKEEGPSVSEAKNKLDNLIEDLNDKLMDHFKKKEQALLNQYTEELVEQQKILN